MSKRAKEQKSKRAKEPKRKRAKERKSEFPTLRWRRVSGHAMRNVIANVSTCTRPATASVWPATSKFVMTCASLWMINSSSCVMASVFPQMRPAKGNKMCLIPV